MTTPIQRRRARQAEEISSWRSLGQTMQRSPLLKQFTRNGRPQFNCGGRPVDPDIAEKSIRWGLITPLDADLFGDHKNSQLWQLKEPTQ